MVSNLQQLILYFLKEDLHFVFEIFNQIYIFENNLINFFCFLKSTMFPGIPVNFSLSLLFTGILGGVQIDGKPQQKWDRLPFEFKKPFLEA